MPQEFKKTLETHLEEIMRRQTMFSSALADINSAWDPLDITDLASSHRDRDLVHSIQHRNYKSILEISDLLRRIEDGTFGICDECSDPIEMARLRVQPTATLCINCQREREMENRATAS